MFMKFKSNEERRAYGRSDFIEIQYCTLPNGTLDKEIVDAVHNWDLSSLFIFGDDFQRFYNEYKEIIGNGLYSNLHEGSIDYCGINYYSREKTIKIIERLKERKPEEFEILLDWLLSDLKYNGFYILGV